MPPDTISGMILCHQDPDVAGSMVDWLTVNPDMAVFSTPRTHVLLPHYGRSDYKAYDVEQAPHFPLPSGGELIFHPAPFLHFPGAFVTYDTESGYLFSGDIWAALDLDWRLVVDSFDEHVPKMDLFHKDYMASNVAARGFAKSLAALDIQAILPQHGSLIRHEQVPSALDYLLNLQCGLDLIYANAGVGPVESYRADITTAEPPEMPRPAEPAPSALEIAETETVEPLSDETALQRESRRLHEALGQAERLAALRDKALWDLRVAEGRLQESEARLAEAQRIAHIGH
jgi:hypothetical protein